MDRPLKWSFLAVMALAMGIGSTRAQPAEPKLTPQDEKFLDSLLKDVLYDPPADARRVRLRSIRPQIWDYGRHGWSEAWLVKGKSGKPDQIFFADGAPQPLSNIERVEEIDFLALCQTRFGKRPVFAQKPGANEEREDPLRKSLEQISEPPLFMAAWLYRRGFAGLAARALKRVDGDRNAIGESLRTAFAVSERDEMVHAFRTRADDLALAHGEWILKRYPKAAVEIRSEARAVVADLKRRKQKGTFGRAPDEKWPVDFETWVSSKKMNFLIERLDEVEALQHSMHGAPGFGETAAVEALIKLGDAAVPALMDVIEKDTRLCRTASFGNWKERNIFGVREAALAAVRSILRVSELDPHDKSGDRLKNEDENEQMIRLLRSYWSEFGRLPLEQRLMKVLTDPTATPAALRDAAYHLSHQDSYLPYGWRWSSSFGRASHGIKSLTFKFESPTVAEAILAAYDRDSFVNQGKKRDGVDLIFATPIEDNYLDALTELGDTRIAGELTRRAAASADISTRRKWAFAAHRLGDSRQLKALANDIRLGRFALPVVGPVQDAFEPLPPDAAELKSIIRTFAAAKLPETERALTAMTDPQHPAYGLLERSIFQTLIDDNRGWFDHPCCLPFLRKAMDDSRVTGRTIRVEDDRLLRDSEHGSSSGPIPPILQDCDARNSEAPERVCDAAACKMTELIVGLPGYHPLLKDADRRLDALKAAYDRFPGTFRIADEKMARLFVDWSYDSRFIPAIGPLNHVATAEDVRKGRAIFHLKGKRKLVLDPLPMRALLASKDCPAHPVLVVQAEADDKGNIYYGVIGVHQIAKVRENEITQLRPLEENQ